MKVVPEGIIDMQSITFAMLQEPSTSIGVDTAMITASGFAYSV